MPAISSLNAWTQEELEKAAKENLGEDKARVKDDIKALQTWIKKSPHLHSIRKDDAYLTMFLRGCKFSLERTKEKLDFHHTVRGNLPTWFDNWDPRQPQLQAILKTGMYLPLRGYDRHGRAVVLMRGGESDPNMKAEDEFKVSTMVMEQAFDGDDQTTICGIVLIQDMAGMTASHALKMNPVVAKKAMTVWQDAYPARPKALHFINMPPVIESVYKMFEGFQKEKMRQRNHVHPKGDLSMMQEDVGLEILPKEYGGTNGTIAELTDYWMKKMEEKRDWLIEQPKFKTDEAKRPGKPKLHSDIFGIEGSFRKLEID
jgi:hypothetical protein